MGNCCGRESGNFSGEGRTLGASPANVPPQTDSARASAPPKISSNSPGRRLGKDPQAGSDAISPREAAARAAEERSQAARSQGGALRGKLQEQQSKTTGQLLQQSADENRAAREADAAAKARTYD